MLVGKKEKEKLSEIQQMCQGLDPVLKQISGRMDALEKSVGRHDIVLEDLSDTLSELREQETDALAALQNEQEANRYERLRSREEKEERLLMLLMEYEGHLRTLESLLSDNEAWEKQFEIIRKKIRSKSLSACVTLLGQEGESLDYEIHEVTDIRETKDQSLDRHVAQVYEAGYIYEGHTKKARVSVWKITED